MTPEPRWAEKSLSPERPMREAIQMLERDADKICVIVDPEGRVIGTVTEGDIRRGLLKGAGIDTPVREIMNAEPAIAPLSTPREALERVRRGRNIVHIPLVDEGGRFAGLAGQRGSDISDVADFPVVLMAGGKGVRLRPLTQTTPKPMLKLGSRPILEMILAQLRDDGFRRIYLAVNYLAHVIEDHFGDGSAFGLDITYLREDKPAGTAGALSLVPPGQQRTLFVMNGDLLTSLSLRRVLAAHREAGCPLTVCARTHTQSVPFGVLYTDAKGRLTHVEEKPVQQFLVNAGIYALEPEVLARVPPERPLDMPELIQGLLDDGGGVNVFAMHETWLDIGRHADFQQAVDLVERGAFP